jgi:hypothetical protein
VSLFCAPSADRRALAAAEIAGETFKLHEGQDKKQRPVTAERVPEKAAAEAHIPATPVREPLASQRRQGWQAKAIRVGARGSGR